MALTTCEMLAIFSSSTMAASPGESFLLSTGEARKARAGVANTWCFFARKEENFENILEIIISLLSSYPYSTALVSGKTIGVLGFWGFGAQ